MDVLMNGLLLTATIFAGGYCWVLARRVRDLKSLDSGLGGAIVTLTRQIELARGTLDEARAATRENSRDLNQLIARSEAAAATLKGALAAARDLEARAVIAGAQAAAAAARPQAEEPALVAPVRERVPAGHPNLRLAVAEADDEEDETAGAFAAPAGKMVVLEDFVPKPRSLPPLESPLRPRGQAAAAPAPRSEDELIEALSALAGGGRR